MNSSRFGLIARFLLALLASLALSRAASAAAPSIAALRGRAVWVQVPPGYERVSLTQRTGARMESWRTLATKPVDAAGGTIVFLVAKAPALKTLSVTGQRRKEPVTDLATGQSLFLADPALMDEIFAYTLSGDLTLMANASASAVRINSVAPAATRTVAESDIWRVAGDRLYFFNELRGLQVFDISNPDDPALLGQLRAPDRGEQMYLLDPTHVALLTRGANYYSFFSPITNSVTGEVLVPSNWGGGSVIIADVSANQPREVARVPYRGTLHESRLVGHALYVVSDVYESGASVLEVAAFDLADPAHHVARGTLALGSYGGVVTATDRFLFVVRYASDWRHSVIDVIDISSPDGAIVQRGRFETAGLVNDKFKLHLTGDTLTAVSAVSRNWDVPVGDPASAARTKVESFSLLNPDAPALLGSLEIGVGESVRATRFVEDRLYVVTFFQIDPLWVIDLTQPAQPKLLGELQVPGFSTYLEPLGDRLVAAGMVNGQTAVSLFDVSDPAKPTLLSQLPLGTGYSSSEANWDEKAFNVAPEDNLIVVPYSGYDPATGYATRVQLIDLTRDALKLRGVVDHGFAARRTSVVGDRLLALSASHLVTVDFADRDHPSVTSDVAIAWRADRVFLAGQYLVQLGGSADWNPTEPPTVNISPANNPDNVLATLDLDKLPVIGATIRDGRLYVAQQQPYSLWSPVDLASIATRPQTTTNPFVLSTFDLSKLPALTLVSRLESSLKTGFGTSNVEAAWPKPGVLVWVGSQSSNVINWLSPMPVLNLPTISTTPVLTLNAAASATSLLSTNLTIAANRFAPIWYWDTSRFDLLAFDVSAPARPVLASHLTDLSQGSARDRSAAFAADGKVFLSFVAADDDRVKAAVGAPSRRFRHFLKVVDYTAPAKPVVAPEVSLPGRLINVLHDGDVLLTAGPRYQAGGKPEVPRAFHLSGFDGKAAHLSDQLTDPAPDRTFAVDGETLLVSKATDLTKASLQAWTVSAQGKFVLASELPTDPATQLTAIHGLLVSSWISRTRFFDVRDPAHLAELGQPRFDDWLRGSLSFADGGAGLGLWVPLSNYGVGVIEFAK